MTDPHCWGQPLSEDELSACAIRGLAMPDAENVVLVLQGGGALGAYQAGAYAELGKHHVDPDWVAGISIGANNAAIICSNPPENRISQLESFWDEITLGPSAVPWFGGANARQSYGEFAAATVMTAGIPGFNNRRLPKPIGYITPTESEEAFYANMNAVDKVA
jgi:predicted acylesterase/phospholipase RssA